LALLSTLLTIYLTASTSFVTRKDSANTATDPDDGSEASKARRRVMYYVRPLAPLPAISDLL
jgi:hypothetical protein